MEPLNLTIKPISKLITNPIQIPKTCDDSKKFFNFINFHLKKNIYEINFQNNDIIFLDTGKNIISINDINYYSSNTNHKYISKIIASFIMKYHYKFNVKYACLKNEIGNPIIYVFLLPYVSQDNYYIIKVGYTKNIIQRYTELKKEFNVEEIYLMYAYKINGEHIEMNVHQNLKSYFQQIFII